MNFRNQILVACGALVMIAPSARAAVFIFDVNLDGPSESPPNASPGIGSGTVTVDSTAVNMRVQVFFSGLLGTTTASHIHAATAVPFTGTAGVATQTPTFAGFPLGVTSGSYDNTFDMTQTASYNPAYVTANGGTTASAFAALLTAMQAGESYLNIHTTVFPGGEIRGFLHPVPEPSSFIGLGVGMAILVRRRKNR